MDTQKVTFVVACKKFFGLHPGQTLAQFGEELKQLTAADRAELTALFPSVGFDIVEPAGNRVAA